MFYISLVVTNNNIVIYAYTLDPTENPATLSHVAINSVVGVKLL